jgi:hypothetical protein
VNSRMARLFAASMVPLAPSGMDLTAPPQLRLDPPALAVPSTYAPGFEAVTYMSTVYDEPSGLGTLRLSDHSAAFAHHNGQLSLEFAGVLPKFPGYRIASEFLGGASIYRVTNADQYLFDNPTICGGKPLRFVVAKFVSLADVKGETTAVNVWLLSLDDYNNFTPSSFDPCGSETFKAAKAG